jgi:hypothetical protein
VEFESGATRSDDGDRFDVEGFLSPIVLERFCEYMHKNRLRSDGTLRDGDDWQKGIPPIRYVQAALRHMLHLWTRWRGFEPKDASAAASLEEDCCAVLFNVMGLLHHILLRQRTN